MTIGSSNVTYNAQLFLASGSHFIAFAIIRCSYAADDNDLSNKIPSELGSLTKLTTLRLGTLHRLAPEPSFDCSVVASSLSCTLA